MITVAGFVLLLRDAVVIPGARRWILANILLAVALILTSINGITSPPSLVLVCTMMLGFVSYVYQAEAIFVFSELRYRRWIARLYEFAGLLAFVAVFAFARNVDALAATMAVFAAPPAIIIVWRMLVRRHRPLRFSDAFVAFAYGTLLVTLIVAIATAPPTGPTGDIINGPAQSLFYGLMFIAIISTQASFVVMTKEESDFRLMRLATTNPLTGIWNRRTFLEAAETELARCRRTGKPLSVIIFDLDHFKRINDEHGHAVGDLVLKRFASAVRALLREYDRVGRYGGEEFTVLLPDTPLDEAVAIADRIREDCHAASITLRDVSVKVTTSAGVATTVDLTESFGSMLARADQALYQAKAHGRDRVEVSDES